MQTELPGDEDGETWHIPRRAPARKPMRHSRLHVRLQRLRHIKRRLRFLLAHSIWADDEYLSRRAAHEKDRAPCSCYMCGNPRRLWKAGDPLQARKADMTVIEEDRRA